MRLLLIIIFTIFFVDTYYSQVLDGVYVKKRVREITNNQYSSYIHNSNFRTSIPKTSFYRVKTNKLVDDSVITSLKTKYDLEKYEINDCVLFKPYENYFYQYLDSNRKNVKLKKSKKKKDKRILWDIVLPNSLRFYVDTSFVKFTSGQYGLIIDSCYHISLDKYYSPFYFKKFEVTNKEYREFVYWVRDSIARLKLFQCGNNEYGKIVTIIENGIETKRIQLNWELPIDWINEKYKVCLQSLYINNEERFYRRKEIDTEKLLYSYTTFEEGVLKQDRLNVYPDTLCWENDFKYSYSEPFVNMYFWHPAYDNYPVVGVNYWQVLAFLDWKTKQFQQQLDKRGIKLIVKFDLPTEMEWEMASSYELQNKTILTYNRNYYSLGDENWNTDLALYPKKIEYFISKKDDDDEDCNYFTTRDDMLFTNVGSARLINDYFGPQICNINLYKKEDKIKAKNNCDIDELGICYLGGNVSEWLKESYLKNWKPFFNKRQQLLDSFDEKDIKIQKAIEQYYDGFNDRNGMLVRGGNWYDNRNSNRLNKNYSGNNAKIFIDPKCAYSTLGFRYVIHYVPK